MDDLERVKHNGDALRYVNNQTHEICLAAVKNYGLALSLVKEQTHEICLTAVQQNGFALRYVKEQTPEICLAAVKQNGHALAYVKEQTPEICLAAVQWNGIALQHVKGQTPEICLAAVKTNGEALDHVKKQTPEICIGAIKNTILALNAVNIVFDISPIRSLFDNMTIKSRSNYVLISNNFIKNLFVFKIDKLDGIEQYLQFKKYDIELVKLLQEYNYVFSKEQILESIKHKVEIPHIHQYGYNLNDPEFMQEFVKHDFYPESYNLYI